MKTRMLRLSLPIAAVLLAAPAADAAVKALSFAIRESSGSGDGTPIKNFMGSNDIDFGVFDYAKSTGYFISADFVNEGRNYKVSSCDYGGGNNHIYKFAVWNSDKYELVSSLVDYKTGENVAAVFRDEFGDEFALLSVRANYKTDSTLAGAKTYIEIITNAWPDAKTIVTYNARLSATYNGNSYSNILDTYLTETASGPQMTRLGRTSGGGAYMVPDDVPASYSVEAVDSIGTTYPGLLVALAYPTKCKVIFNDWDGTGLQTNIVYAGESVTPPTPQREGYTFTGWDHPASDFASVPESFTATAQYSENIAWLLVSGDPEQFGTADPVYGTTSTNGSFTASVTATNLLESSVERWVCTGYTHYEITDVVTGAKTVAQEGNAASFAYTHVFQDELVWHFTNEWLVTASATTGGSVSTTEAWVRNGETLPLVATPDAGYAFWRWFGDTDGIADVSAASIAPTITAARTLRAVFAPAGADASVQYVAMTGNDANSGYFSNAPKLTVQAAIDTLAAAPGYGTVHVGAGTYVLQNTVLITNAIAVLGATGRPEDVVLRAKNLTSTSTMTTLRVNHPDALVANLVIENGRRYNTDGGNVWINESGGTVSNCVIRGASGSGNWLRGTGAWLNSSDALLTHCVITNNSGRGAAYPSTTSVTYGLYVHVDKGTVANCLIANNTDSGSSSPTSDGKTAWSCGVKVVEGSIVNCTVVTNEARNTAGVYLEKNGFATNVVVAGCVNTCSCTNSLGEIVNSDVGFKGTLANAYHCASDGGEALDDTCVDGTVETFFRDHAAHDWRPATGGPLVDKGVAYEGIAVIDLLGNRRSQGRPDIGCYENPPVGTLILVK